MELTVLLIDGDHAHAVQVQQFLLSVRPRWRVLHATDLADGQAQHAQYQPQLAMVAFKQADGDALQALRWLGDAMGLVMVEWGQEELAALSLRAGFADFVVRPLQPGSNRHLQALPEQLESLARQRATEWALAEHGRELHSTLSSISQGVLSLDAQGRVQLYNERALELLDIPEAHMQQQPLLRELVEFQRERGECERPLHWPLGATVGDLDARNCPPVYIRHTQDGRYLEVRTHPERDGRRVRTYTDVTDYVQTQQQLSQSEQRWRSMTALSSDWFWELDARLRFVHLDGCPEALQQSLYTQYFWAQTLWQQAHDATESIANRQELMARHEAFHDWELCHHDGDGSPIWLSLSGTPVWDAQDVFIGYRGVARNITERKQSEVKIRRLAYRDDLTDLPNRAAMLQQIDSALERSLQCGAGALLMLDVDHFKGINDAMGHRWGDALLQEVARRLQAWCGPGNVVGRVGGDEFLVLIEALAPDMAQAQVRASAMAVSLIEVLAQAFELQGRAVHASFGIGAAGFLGRERSVDEMRQCVELALSEAKAQGRNAWSIFDPELQRNLRARAQLEADLHIALDREDFVLHYQPVVDDLGSVLGAEALVRWIHPERGMVSPGQFIPVAEQLGLIYALDRWVLRQACLQLAAWALHPTSACWTLAVNLSAQEFRHADFLRRIQDILRDTGARPDLLKLELTESLMLEAVEESIAKMQALRAMGIRFSLDDFGVGYSSLGYLKRLPLSQLKIDQSFVRDVLLDANDAAIVRTVIALGQSLGLEVVAEGVETQGQLEFLVLNGCRRFQGYLFGRPAKAEVLLES